MRFIKAIALASSLAGITACATISTPEGGAKDLVPPTLQSSSPQDQQLNVKTSVIRLVFDEEVQPKSLTKELLITPNITNKYEVKSNRNELTLEFEKPLQDSTTFTFNFREGIVDITEQNKAEGLKLSFSTGSFIDSSSVSGRVINLLKQTPEKDAVVALYQAEDTMSVRKNRPYYLTITDAEGNYQIENIKQGSYRVYALIDKNKNTYYDSEEERIAYLTEPLRIMPHTDSVTLYTVRLDTKKPILLQREKYTDRFVANYNEGIAQVTAKLPGSETDTLVQQVSRDGKAIELFKTSKYNGGKTIFTAVDSSGNMAIDTLEIAFEGKRAARIKGAQLKVMNIGTKGGYRPGETITLELETPVRINGTNPVTLMSDTIVVAQLNYPDQIRLDRTGTALSFILPDVNNRVKQLQVNLDSTAILPLQGDPLSFRPIGIAIAEARGTGSISGSITTKSTSYIVQLLNSDYKVVEEKRDPKKNVFKNIEPGTYRVRVLVDENNNGNWDKGDPEMKNAPEKVYIYPEAIDVRANWERDDIHLEF
ncbi:Ig-like domain-containing protein [Pontibacter sp. E15-1]|uniref:Ig-like domain-containing protein n=1 Tax=Pontibacter sp. E15-1 TaxID=2919918 RepID=UPI001F4F1ACF|nr:Ig-like domain-containing protein [Pontibacter sp. E15-1]MCJ8163774.1 Ig-like domain-containing protein [Pontibacter sp. E15-1]